MDEEKRLIPFGEISESFTGLRDEGIYYVDKTGFIPFLIEEKRKICVVTRPRRFGKTLMLRTLQTFFEYRLDKDGNPIDNRRYFDGLKVMDAGEDVLKHLGQYPVISLSFKDVSGDTYTAVVSMLNDAVCRACRTHRTFFKSSNDLSESEATILRSYQDGMASEEHLMQFLGKYSDWLWDVTHRQSVILLDEYDVPLQKAAIYCNRHPGSDLFDKTVKLIGKFISAGFKSNDNLAFGVISGCMRVAKESIFTGMNNPGVITVLSKTPDEFWGFTEAEVKEMLAYYGQEDKYPQIERWYDGYFYGGRKVFNPWSLLNAIRGLVNEEGDLAIKAYWSLTSGNDIIDDMIDRNPAHREGLAKLMNGETMTVTVYENLSYRDLQETPDAIWSFLLYTGYLKSLHSFVNEDNLLQAVVAIPNIEIKTIMALSLRRWWNFKRLAHSNVDILIQALLRGENEVVERELRIVLKDSTSYFDYNEAFYHGMLVGLLQNGASVRSNDEYGEGRPDIVAVTAETGIIIEVKCVTPKALAQAIKAQPDLDELDIIDAAVEMKLNEAEKQIKDRKYMRAVLRDEPEARTVVAYAICFCKKWCKVRKVAVE